MPLGVRCERHRVRIDALCRLTGKTGVEMEAPTAPSVAALTIYDMCKAVHKDVVIGPVRLLAKSGGKSGDLMGMTCNYQCCFAQVRELTDGGVVMFTGKVRNHKLGLMSVR